MSKITLLLASFIVVFSAHAFVDEKPVHLNAEAITELRNMGIDVSKLPMDAKDIYLNKEGELVDENGHPLETDAVRSEMASKKALIQGVYAKLQSVAFVPETQLGGLNTPTADAAHTAGGAAAVAHGNFQLGADAHVAATQKVLAPLGFKLSADQVHDLYRTFANDGKSTAAQVDTAVGNMTADQVKFVNELVGTHAQNLRELGFEGADMDPTALKSKAEFYRGIADDPIALKRYLELHDAGKAELGLTGNAKTDAPKIEAAKTRIKEVLGIDVPEGTSTADLMLYKALAELVHEKKMTLEAARELVKECSGA